MFGEWAFVRGGGRTICGVTLENTAKDADSFALAVKTVCDPLILRFGPVAWKMDRGQLILVSAKGDLWRFEEADSTTVPTLAPRAGRAPAAELGEAVRLSRDHTIIVTGASAKPLNAASNSAPSAPSTTR